MQSLQQKRWVRSLWQHLHGRAGALLNVAHRCCGPSLFYLLAASQRHVRTELIRALLSHTPGISLQRKPAGGGRHTGNGNACPPAQKPGKKHGPVELHAERGWSTMSVTVQTVSPRHDRCWCKEQANTGKWDERLPNPMGENREARWLPDLGLAKE